MERKCESDEINYMEFFNIIKKRKLHILLIVVFVMSLVLFLDLIKKEKVVYTSKLNMQFGYITYVPGKKNIDFSDDIVKKFYLKKVYLEDPRVIVYRIREKIKNLNIKYNYDVANSLLIGDVRFKQTSEDEDLLKQNIQQAIEIVLSTSNKLGNISKEDNIKVYYPKVVLEEYSKEIVSATKAKTLKMKMIVAFVMGLIFAVIAVIFLNSIKENK